MEQKNNSMYSFILYVTLFMVSYFVLKGIWENSAESTDKWVFQGAVSGLVSACISLLAYVLLEKPKTRIIGVLFCCMYFASLAVLFCYMRSKQQDEINEITKLGNVWKSGGKTPFTLVFFTLDSVNFSSPASGRVFKHSFNARKMILTDEDVVFDCYFQLADGNLILTKESEKTIFYKQ